MKTHRAIAIGLVGTLLLAGCSGGSKTPQDNNQEIERRVQERLAEEARARAQKELQEREAALAGREKEIAEREARLADAEQARLAAAAATPVPTATPPPAPEPEVLRGVPVAEPPEQTAETFYEELAPYGDWIESPEYGFVFRPTIVVTDFAWRPYAVGRWVWTDYGWTWLSDEPFGWACYHYGRWTRLRGLGWVWVPGTEWAPAWVCWRFGSGWCGWAPLPPQVGFGGGVTIDFDVWDNYGAAWFNFVPATYFCEPTLRQHLVNIEKNVTIINQTRNVTRITRNKKVIVNHGPAIEEVQTHIKRTVPRLKLATSLDAKGGATVQGDLVQIKVPRPRTGGATRPRQVKGRIDKVEVERGAVFATAPAVSLPAASTPVATPAEPKQEARPQRRAERDLQRPFEPPAPRHGQPGQVRRTEESADDAFFDKPARRPRRALPEQELERVQPGGLAPAIQPQRPDQRRRNVKRQSPGEDSDQWGTNPPPATRQFVPAPPGIEMRPLQRQAPPTSTSGGSHSQEETILQPSPEPQRRRPR